MQAVGHLDLILNCLGSSMESRTEQSKAGGRESSQDALSGPSGEDRKGTWGWLWGRVPWLGVKKMGFGGRYMVFGGERKQNRLLGMEP